MMSFLMICRLIDFSIVVLYLLMFKVCRIIAISIIELFKFSDFLCNFLNLSLNLKSLTHVQFRITIIFITKEASWCKIFDTDTALLCVSKFSIVSVLPCSVSRSFSNSFPFRTNFDLLFLAPQSLWKTAWFSISYFASSLLSLYRKQRFFNLTGRAS